jgi:2-keto-4-pentenoate hydratase/2-oxohepta-3-ene-1,7-dioic acid hydratase in catechol pathway
LSGRLIATQHDKHRATPFRRGHQEENRLRIATYWWGGRRHVGRLTGDGKAVVPLALGERAHAVGALALVEAMASGAREPRPAGTSLPLGAIRLDAPIPVPRRNIFCSGVNYRAHAAEWASSGLDAAPGAAGQAPRDAGQGVPEHPVIFSKVPDCVVAPGAPIRIPERASTAIDYEAELAVIVGKAGRDIPASRAMAHVWGYTGFNDVTARDLQRRHRQWLIGKSLDTFGPMGPCLVSADEVDGTDTRALIFGIPELIAAISNGLTLHPGDIIATGTPSGVGMGFQPPRYLKRGDVVRIEIDGIGVLENPVQ